MKELGEAVQGAEQDMTLTGKAPGDACSVQEAPLDKFHQIERVRLVDFNTPIERCDRLREKIPGAPNLFIKRDDYAGYLGGGNKLRKIEYLMDEIIKTRTTSVITVGSIQSNHARVMSMVARRFGLKCVLVVNGRPAKRPTGNFLVNSLLGVKVFAVNSRAEREPKMQEIAGRLERAGEHVYQVPLGASNEIGAFGMVGAFEEVCSYQLTTGIKFDAIFLASSSGGTQSGLEVGKRLCGYPEMEIFGISPDDSIAEIKNNIVSIMKPMLNRLGMDTAVASEDIQVDDHYIGKGYGISSAASLRAARMFQQTEGILLDPVYTSKAAAALIDYCRKGRFGPSQNVLFWHTGGLLALFK